MNNIVLTVNGTSVYNSQTSNSNPEVNSDLDENNVNTLVYKKVETPEQDIQYFFLNSQTKKLKEGVFKSVYHKDMYDGYTTYFMDNVQQGETMPILYTKNKQEGGRNAERKEEKRREENPEENITRKNNFEYNTLGIFKVE